MPNYIAVAGNMGCGKSTLVEFICSTFGVKPFLEPNEDNPYLKPFYADMKRWAFQSQLWFLSRKFRLHQELEDQRKKTTVVQDRTIFEDAEIFAAYLFHKKCITPTDWQLYQDLYQTILNAIEPPSILIYLRASLRTVRHRIRIRGRKEEQKIPVTYLRHLNELYEKWFSNYRRSPTLLLETDNLNYLSDLIHRADILKRIEKHL